MEKRRILFVIDRWAEPELIDRYLRYESRGRSYLSAVPVFTCSLQDSTLADVAEDVSSTAKRAYIVTTTGDDLERLDILVKGLVWKEEDWKIVFFTCNGDDLAPGKKRGAKKARDFMRKIHRELLGLGKTCTISLEILKKDPQEMLGQLFDFLGFKPNSKHHSSV